MDDSRVPDDVEFLRDRDSESPFVMFRAQLLADVQGILDQLPMPCHGGGGGDQVLQMQSTTAGQSSTTSTSYVDATGATLTITISSTTSKVLVLVSCMTQMGLAAGVNARQTVALNIAGSDITNGESMEATESGSGGLQGAAGHAWTYLDSPGAAGSRTYKLRHKVANSSTVGYIQGIRITLVEIEP